MRNTDHKLGDRVIVGGTAEAFIGQRGTVKEIGKHGSGSVRLGVLRDEGSSRMIYGPAKHFFIEEKEMMGLAR